MSSVLLANLVHRAIVKVTWHVKIRTYAKNAEELWFEEWRSPLQIDVDVQDPATFLQRISDPLDHDGQQFYVDKLPTGFLVWASSVKSYRPVGPGTSPFEWEADSQPALQAIRDVLHSEKYFEKLLTLLGQESNKNPNRITLRAENVIFVKSIGALHQSIELLVYSIWYSQDVRA